MKAMILAAGLGTRLKPLTDTMPKALVPVMGRPLLGILLDKLAASGFGRVVVNVHHFASQITDYVAAHRADYPHMDILISDETAELLDTGGAVRHAAPLLLDGSDEPVLIHNADILGNVDLRSFYRTAQGHDATLLVSERASSRGLFLTDDDLLCGWTNHTTGEVKGRASGRVRAFSGIHALSPRLIERMAERPARFPIIPFYIDMCDEADVFCADFPHAELLDVGKLDALDAAEAFLKKTAGTLR